MTLPAPAAARDDRWSPRRAAGNVAAVALAQVVGKCLTLVWTVVAARVLTQREFGEFNFALSLALILSAIAEWGFDPALVRLASRSAPDRDRHYTEAILAESVVGLLLFGAVLAAVLPSRSGDDRLAMGLVFAAIFVDLWNDTGRSVGATAARQGRTSMAMLLQRFATAAFVLPLLWAGAGIAGLAAGMLGGYVVGWVATILALRSFGARLRPGTVTLPQLRSFVLLSLPIGVSSMILALVSRVDMVLVEVFRGSRSVAAYATAYKLFETVLFVTFAVSSATFPMMSAVGDDGEKVRRIARISIGTMAVLLIPFTCVCLVETKEVLGLVFGDDYRNVSAGALRWLAPCPLVFSVAYVGGTALIAVGRNRGLVVTSAAALGVNVAVNLLVIPHWGGTGAALVTTLSYAVEAVVTLVLLRSVAPGVGGAAVAVETIVPGLLLAAGLWVVHAPLAVEVPVGLAGYLACWTVLAKWRAPEQVDFVFAVLRGRRPA